MGNSSNSKIEVLTIDENFIASGLRFECQGSGKCCTSHGQYGYVFLTLEDRRRLANKLKISTQVFTRRYCERRDGVWALREVAGRPDCQFLSGRACSVYEARPLQCRTWPFWPEVLNPKTWSRDVKGFCPGVGKGKLFSPKEIRKIAMEQLASEGKFT